MSETKNMQVFLPDITFLKKKDAVELANKYGTPLFIYSKKKLQENCRDLQEQMSWNPGFKEFFPVYALNNPALLKILNECGCGVRCHNEVELRLAQMAGIPGEDILFTSCYPSLEDWEMAVSYGTTIILDNEKQLEMFTKKAYGDRVLGLRLNFSEKIGIPVRDRPGAHVKTGMPMDNLLATAKLAAERGYKRVGLHLSTGEMYGSPHIMGHVTKVLLTLANKIRNEIGLEVAWCDLGVGFPYKVRGLEAITVDETISAIRTRYDRYCPEDLVETGIPLYLGVEEHLTASSGLVLTRVRSSKSYECIQVGLDICISDMPKIGLGSDKFPFCKATVRRIDNRTTYAFVGKLPIRNDYFTGKQAIPHLGTGDLVVIQMTGAGCRSMSNNNYGNLRCPEILLDENGYRLIARRETFEDYIRYLQRD